MYGMHEPVITIFTSCVNTILWKRSRFDCRNCKLEIDRKSYANCNSPRQWCAVFSFVACFLIHPASPVNRITVIKQPEMRKFDMFFLLYVHTLITWFLIKTFGHIIKTQDFEWPGSSWWLFGVNSNACKKLRKSCFSFGKYKNEISNTKKHFFYLDYFCVNEALVRKIELDLIVCPFPMTSSSGLEEINLGPSETNEKSSFCLGVCSKQNTFPVVWRRAKIAREIARG